MIEPSGLSYGYFGCAAGKAAASARTLIEKLDLKNMKCRDAVIEAAKMYVPIHHSSLYFENAIPISIVFSLTKNSGHLRK
jgi:20S proteasome subunit alpha 7